MGGLFGGLLGLVNLVGGLILYLLIGAKAWRENEKGRDARRRTGAIFIAIPLGFILYVFLSSVDYFSHDERYIFKWGIVLALPIIFIISISMMENLRKGLNE